MSLALQGNIERGWPNPHIVEKVAKADATCAAGTATPLLGFMGGHLDPVSGTWKLGVTATSQQAYLFRNGVYDSDAGRAAAAPADYVQAVYGGIQGISLDNPLLFSTAQIATGFNPAVDSEIFCDVDGKWKQAVSGSVVVARVDRAVFPYQGGSFLGLRPVAPYVKA